MKKLYSLVILTGIAFNAFSQTNSFPSSGDVGIGTISPQALLHIGAGSVSSTNRSTQLIVTAASVIGNTVGSYLYPQELDATSTSNNNRLQTVLYRRIAGSAWQGNEYRLQYAVDNSFTNGSKAFIAVGSGDPVTSGGGFISLATAGFDRLVVNNAGNVGIGTISPISTFQVGDNQTKTSIGSAGSADLHYGTGYLGFNAARSSGNWTVNGDGSHNGGGVIYSDIVGNIYIAPIPSNGTTTQTLADLDVKGDIRLKIGADGIVYAKQITVETTSWPDYVFNKDYTLLSLSTLKTYIDQNHHLPDMPSAQKVTNDGVNLGEMDKALVKKVEELTLYLINKDEQIKSDENKLKAQADENNLMKEQIDLLKQEVSLLKQQTEAINKQLEKKEGK